MANIRVIPLENDNQGIEDLAVANAAVAVFPKDSMWLANSSGDLTVSSVIAGRVGSWVSRFNLNSLDTPPLIEWKYSANTPNDAEAVIQNEASRAQLRVSNLDLQPRPQDIYPDIHWTRNGLDIIPRSAE
tara:strand:- start:42 stop:431 length:390 start_codon:yes stop_codon:yes gene_type:complete